MSIVEKIILAIQISAYLASVLLVFVKPAKLNDIIWQCALAFLAILIKVVRQRKNWKYLLQSQLSFYLAYFLIGLQIVFYYKALSLLFESTTVGWSITNIIIKSINYSLLMHPKTAKKLQLFAYSIGEGLHAVMSIVGTLEIVYIFDELQTADYEKDMILLFTAAVLAEAILVLDLMFRVYEKKQSEKSQLQTNLIQKTVQLSSR